MKPYIKRSGHDRRKEDLGPRGKLPERRRQPERRLPTLNESHDMSFEAFQRLLEDAAHAAKKAREAPSSNE
ncbi:hypothetical protein [Accumulibacter sp.]|uniref:hypothetical protein n=1 Tax=Accumulibacter sp. TaxID=2053492 RepID=UPI0025EB112E|nr:hypothetical protein [Accumulibacter sp.]MCM8594501.1 hypothetical protein [Accumulibacter sp.]MCM8626766.1 hypothetical protein [Accumulibacter sp.]MDS4048647.1 hypothetical protein [Accumulibacter sp.]